MDLKKPENREIAYSWAVYDVEKWEWATAARSNESNESKESKRLMASP